MRKLKKTPQFKNEDAERAFWSKHDSVDYIDWSKAKRMRFPNLKPSARSISIRLPESLLVEIKRNANRQDIPYQSYLKTLLHEGVTRQRKR